MPNHSVSISALQQASGLALSYRVREPVPSRPSACLILLHGVGGNETNLAELAAAVDPSVLVLLPRGPVQLGVDQCAWFRVAFSANGPRLDPAEANQARETLLAFIGDIQTRYGLDAGQVVMAGFSQGGIMSASVALSEPEQVRGFGILSGRILPELAPYLADRDRLAPLQAFIGHGDADSVLPVSWAQRSEQMLGELGVAYDSRRYAAGHMLTNEMKTDFLAWLDALLGTRSTG